MNIKDMQVKNKKLKFVVIGLIFSMVHSDVKKTRLELLSLPCEQWLIIIMR